MIVKICGLTRQEDAEAAVRYGATAVGFVFWPRSPRCVSAEHASSIIRALHRDVLSVGVFVDAPIAEVRDTVASAGLGAVQLHGTEPPEYAGGIGCPVWKALGVDAIEESRRWPAGVSILVDAIDPVRRGGTGTPVDWPRAAAFARERQIVLAGGLTPENVEDAIVTVKPFGVDTSSGVERSPGVKDHGKMERFILAARRAFDRARAEGVEGVRA